MVIKGNLREIILISFGCEFVRKMNKTVKRLDYDWCKLNGVTKSYGRLSMRFLSSTFFLCVGSRPTGEVLYSELWACTGQERNYLTEQCSKMVELGYFELVRKVGQAPVYRVNESFWQLFEHDFVALLDQRLARLRDYDLKMKEVERVKRAKIGIARKKKGPEL